LVTENIEKILRILEKSKNPIILTGAGVSTSSGIPDYRSSFNTILPTGPGKWETEENKQIYLEKNKK
jgi:NAD-dependent SIR2 family protein deacetylase